MKLAGKSQSQSLTKSEDIKMVKPERMKPDDFMERLRMLYKEQEVYPNYCVKDFEPYPFEMWLHDAYEVLCISAKF